MTGASPSAGAPRLPGAVPEPETRTAALDDGRTLAYVECGDPAGRPVFAFHGLPGSRMQRHPDESIARGAGVRVIHVDRPGFGRSSPRPGRSLADWPRDVAALADRLGLGRFAVAGTSGGGPFAAACAALLGDRVARLAIVSGVGPPGTMAGRMTANARLAFFLAPRVPWLLRGPLAAAGRFGVRAPSAYVSALASHMSPPDRAILARSEVRAMLAQDLREAFRQGTRAMVHDLGLLARPWRLPLDRVACPAALWHGADDWMIPPAASRALVRALPGARAHDLPGEGHFLVLDRWPEICAWLARDGGGTA
jgi:pimeloyl-ACP methyl ester carboxylesterase